MSEASSAAPESSSAAPSSSAADGAAAGGAGGGSNMMLIIGGVVVLVVLGAAGVFVVLSGKSTGGATTESTESTPAKSGPGGGTHTNTSTGNSTHNGGSNNTDHHGNTTELPPHNTTGHHNPTNGPGGKELTDAQMKMLGPPTPGAGPAPPGYHGFHLGPFLEGHHEVAGHVYIRDETTFFVMDFTFDGKAPRSFFMVKDSTPPDETGTQLKDDKGTSNPLQAYTKQNFEIKLEGGKKVTDYQFFYVECVQGPVLLGYVEINSSVVKIPAPLTLDQAALVSPNKKVTATAITLVDTLTIKFEGAKVDKSLDYAVKAGTAMPPKDDATAVTLTPAMIPDKPEAQLMLPKTSSWMDFHWIAFFDSKTHTAEATITLPANDTMIIPVHPDAKSNTRRRRAKGRRTAGMSAVKAAPSKPKLLVCSYGESGVVKTMVPSDGLCDVIFYTDVTYDNDAEAIVPRDGGPAFDVLKSAAKQYTKTSFGTSMATGAIADAVKDKKSELMAAMGDIFSSKLSHFGMLNVENIEDYDKLKDTDLQYIKVADEFLQGKPSSLTSHRALGFSLRDGSKGPKILDAAKQISSDFPELTIVIIKLHTENYGPSGDHWPLAPNPDDVDLSEHNALSLAAIKEDLEEPLQAIAKEGTYALLSFAMFARTYRMKQTWSGAAAREMSESSLNMDYSSVCKMKTEKDSEDTGTLYATDEHKKFLALFDSENTFTAKTNNRLNVMPQNFTGLAVYNVEMDDHKGICGKGKFVRLKAIKAALAA